ncbi:hypothetical protein [Frondihabitans sp. 762G35]|uniref:hypothetical protein n=1 Tax=Frondihabitans sp. 762G35 TaxID=1446794 RepID=UPI000F4DE54D|nr:hypothetical protein [Frondihabitans sp. 762G35]
MNSDRQDPTSDIVVQQLRITKWVGVGGGIIMALAGGFFIYAGTTITPGWPWFVIGVLAIVFGIVTAIRIPRARVTLRQDQMVVYGQLWSRTIPRQSITSITPWPFVKWTDSRGRKRSTPVSVLNARGALPKFAEHAHEGRDVLHKWAGVGGDYLDDER